MMRQQSSASGSAILDTPPPSPRDKIYEKNGRPGDDTASLLGETDSELEGGNPALQGPGGKLIMAVAMFMQASNLADSITPGFVPEPIKQWIAMAMQQAPQMAEQMARQGDPMAMLSAVGGSAAASGASPMGMPAMGLAGGAQAGGRPQPQSQPQY